MGLQRRRTRQVRVKAQSDRPLFIGIARAADLEQYLRGTEHDEVSSLTYHPFQVDCRASANYHSKLELVVDAIVRIPFE
jgi:hypothetical protein